MAQAEVWVERACQEREMQRNLQALTITERIADLLVAAGLLKRL